MRSYENTRFRITTRPSIVIAPTTVVVPHVLGVFRFRRELLNFIEEAVRLGDGSRLHRIPLSRDRAASLADRFVEIGRGQQVVVVNLTTPEVVSREVPVDLYLRGLLGDFFEDTMPMACDDLGPVRVPQGLIDAQEEWVGIPGDDQDDEWHWRSVLEYLRGQPGSPDLRGAEEVEFLVTDDGKPFVLDLRLYGVEDQLRVMALYRAVAVTVLHLTELAGGDAAALEHVTDFWTIKSLGLPVPNTLDQAIRTAVRILNLTAVGLAPPRLELTDSRTETIVTEPPGSDLLTVLAGQILAHVSEGAPVRQCANEPCGRLFRHQVGRAKFGQLHTKGVKYCTDSCARAAAQRAYRRRKRGPQAQVERSEPVP